MANGSPNGFPPSKSSIASPRLSKSSSTGSVDNDENDSSQCQMIPKAENQKKMVAKNFMSPTISAAAKAVSPRKKILCERNENPVISDSQNFGAKNFPQGSVIDQSDQASSMVVSSYSYGSESDDIKGDTDSLAKGYDPTNYRIPRPKYLRYNPSRRSEVLDKLVNESISLNGAIDYQEVGDAELPSSVDDVGLSSFSTPNDEKVDETVCEECDVEEEEEGEEELKGKRGGCLGFVLKHMLMLSVCLMFMSYISPMNSPAPFSSKQCLWNSTDGYLFVREPPLDFMSTKLHDSLGFLGVEVVGDDGYWVPEGGIEVDRGSEDDRASEEMAEANGENLEGRDDGATEFEFGGGNSFEQMMAVEFDRSAEDTRDSLEMEAESEAVEDEMVGAGKMESDLTGFGPLKESESVYVIAVESKEMDSNKEEFEPSEIPKEEDDGTTLQEEEEFKQEPGSESSEGLHGLADEELTGSNSEFDYEAEMWELRWSISVVVGVFLGALLLAASAFVYRPKKARGITKESKAAVAKQPKQKKAAEVERLTTTTTTTLQPPPMERKVEFLARPSLPQPPREAPSELNYRANAPTVELIGEIVIGGRKSSANTFQVNEYFKESNATYAVPKQTSLPQPVSTPIQRSAFEPSLYGSIATDTKIIKKEGGQSGEAPIQSTTPLRRSARLRRAAAMSP